MVSLSISIKGKPSITVDFPGKHPDKVTVKEVKAAVEAKFPQVGGGSPAAHGWRAGCISLCATLADMGMGTKECTDVFPL
jgi:very-long-chain enoyl-CoA reductase